MADLLQIVQSGDQHGQSGDQYSDIINWRTATEYVVPAWNRTRILDREASRGIHPGEDGWLTYSRRVGPINGVHVIVWTRIRWQNHSPPEAVVQNLDGGEV